MTTAHGGKREGSGRLTKLGREDRARKAAFNRELFDLKTVAAMPELWETLHDLAKGIWVEEVEADRQGNEVRRVYREKPDRQALMFLVEHGIGKAAAKVQQVQDTQISLIVSHPRPNRKMKGELEDGGTGEGEDLGRNQQDADNVAAAGGADRPIRG